MTIAPTTDDENAAKRRIGDILLELGFVSEEALAKAAEEQDKSGQPLGQILVEHGAITRLELASALAEQWSDQVSIQTLPVPTGPPRVVPRKQQHHDEDQYAARLQEAVADLTQRVRRPDAENTLDSRLVELAERIESTVARTQRLEATVATLVESLEGVTSGVEEAFGVLQSGMSGLAIDIARIETSVAELSAHADEPASDPALAGKLDELWRFVHELADRPVVDGDARARADELTERIEPLADQASLDEVQGSLEGLRVSLANLDDLRAVVAEVAARPAGSPDVDVRLERLEALLDGQAAAASTAIESIAGRLDAALAAQSSLETSVGRLDEGLEQLTRDLATSAEASLAEHVEAVDSRLAAFVTGEELSLALERTRQELASIPAEPDPRIEDLSRELAGIRDELHDAIAARLEAVEAQLEAELASSSDPEAAKALASLSERIEELSRERHHQEEVTARLDALDRQLAGLVTNDELSGFLERTRKELTRTPQEPDPRIEETAAKLEVIEARVEAGLASSTDPEAAKALASLSERIEELSRERHHQEELAAKLDALEARLPTDTVTTAQLTEALESVQAERASIPTLDATAELEETIAGLTEKLSGLDVLQARVEELAEATGAAPAVTFEDEELRRELVERVAELARTVDETLVANREQPGDATGVPESVEEDMERFRMTLERLSMHLADHDRMLAEMRSARGVTQRLDELAAQVGALAAGGVASPDGDDQRRREAGLSRDLEANEMRQLIRRIEDCEEAAHEGREKLMKRLERMASSIDWRLQRLEADEPEP